MMQINYYLKPVNDSVDLKNSFLKVIEYLLTFVGDIEVKKENESSAIIYYIGTPTVAFLTLNKTLTVTISAEDNLTINLIKNIASNIGIRIYNSKLNCYLLNDTNIIDLSTIKVDQTIKKILNLYHLIPLFQYRQSLIFFCLNKKKEVVLINRHYLEYLLTAKDQEPIAAELFVKIADNISQFVALFDRGLISLTNPNSKIINLSGFDLQKLPKNTKLLVINFSFDEENQSFIQQDTTNKIPKKYLALKIGQDYTYSMIEKKLTKFLNISVFNI